MCYHDDDDDDEQVSHTSARPPAGVSLARCGNRIMHCAAVQCTAQYRKMRCCTAVCIKMLHCELHCTALYTVRCIALHCNRIMHSRAALHSLHQAAALSAN